MSVRVNKLNIRKDERGIEYLVGNSITDSQMADLVNIHRMKEEGTFLSGLDECLLDLPLEVINSLKSGKHDLRSLAPEDIIYGSLKDYQTLGVAFIEIAKRALLGYSVGLGKTAIFSGLVRRLYLKASKSYKETTGEELPRAPFRFLFLTGASPEIRTQAINELTRYTGFNCLEVSGRKNSIEPYVNQYYEAVEEGLEHDWSVVASNTVLKNPLFREMLDDYERRNGVPYFDVICIDEISSVISKNTNTDIYKSVNWLFNESQPGSRPPKYITAITATPFEGNLETMYRLFDLLDPSMLPGITRFRDTYCVMERGPLGYDIPVRGKYKNVDDFKNSISLRYIAYTRQDVGSESIESSAAALVTKLTPAQRSLSEMSSQKGMVTSAPQYIDDSLGLRDISKVKALDLLLNTALRDPDELALIYAHNLPAQAAVKQFMDERGIPSTIINGETPSDIRLEELNKFKSGKYQILITNLERGLNIPEASHVVFYQIPQSPSKITQIEGRMVRSKDIVGKHSWYLVTYGVQDSELDALTTTVRDLTKASVLAQGRDLSLYLDFCDNPVYVDVDNYDWRDPEVKGIYDYIIDGGDEGFEDMSASLAGFDDENVVEVDVSQMSSDQLEEMMRG